MTIQPETPTTADAEFAPFTVNVRIRLSALWATMLFVFAYIDIFSFFRPDVRADIEAGAIAGFTIGPAFLLWTTLYILLPTLMVFAALVLRPQVNRVANIALAAIYAATIVAGAVGEWSYYLLGSAVEVALLGGIVFYAWTWPRRSVAVPRGAREAVPPVASTIP